MISRARRLRFRRKLRQHRHQLQEVGVSADQYFFRRLDHLVHVRRFVVVWVLFISLLIGCSAAQLYSLSGYYQKLKPAAGGRYTEGVIGAFTNANPLFASSVADRTVSRLVFSSLLTYDTQNRLAGDLAESWSADDKAQVYTVKLRPDLKWHDGRPLTAEDVAFTYQVIQNPDAQSSLQASWQGVTVKVVDTRTITFTLGGPFVAFPHSLTNGIIPKHVLKDVPMADMRSVAFNTVNPVGSGPFKWQDLTVSGGTPETREERILLAAYAEHHHGKPKLENFSVRVFRDEERMRASFERRELQAMVGLINEPRDVSDIETYSFPQTAAMMTFFRTSEGILAEKPVRQALVQAVDVAKVRKQLPYAAIPVDQPLLKGQLGYDGALAQLGHDKAAAAKLLDDAGWKQDNPQGIREKDGAKLEFTLFAESNSETARVSRILQQEWREIGVDAKVELQSTSEFQVTLSQHGYDALLRSIAIGSDPDVFVYWHSSQADVLAKGRLNYSEYKSGTADAALEQARSRTDENVRAAKYKPFLSAWRDDAPALGLYQTRFLYITRQPVYGLEVHTVNSQIDRLANVEDWMVRSIKTTVDN